MKSILFLLLLGVVACSDPPALGPSSRLKVTPNPPVHAARVQVIDPVYPFSIKVFDPIGKFLTGKEVASSADVSSGNFSFQMPDLAGRYTVTLEMDGNVYTTDVIRP